MKEAFDKIIEWIEKSKTYSCSPQFERGLDYSIKIVNNVAEKCKDKYVSIGAYNQVAWERDIAIKQLHELGYEFGENIDKEEFCEWFKYDYRTIAPKNHDVKNPYWRIPENWDKIKYCPYCSKKIKVVE